MTNYPPKPSAESRPLISLEAAPDIADMFYVLFHCSRIHTVHFIFKAGNLNVTALTKLTKLKLQALLNQRRCFFPKKRSPDYLLTFRGVLWRPRTTRYMHM